MTNTDRNSESFLKDLAEGYSGNGAEAERIAKEAVNDSDPLGRVRLLSIMYVQSRDRDLFEAEAEPQENMPELSEISDLSRDLADMDHEERIVSLMKVYEGKDNAAIAEILGISEDHVKALLQSAAGHMAKTPGGILNHPEEEDMPPQPQKEEEKFRISLSLKAWLIIAAGIVFALGVFFSVRSYAHGQYERGMAALERGDYAEAVRDFRRAAGWGEGDQAILKIGDAYFLAGNDIDAYTHYEDYHEKFPRDEYAVEQMVLCLRQQADRYILANDLKHAETALEKMNSLQPSVYTDYRLRAISEGGTFQTADGSVWNMYGQLVRAACLNDAGTVLYTVELLYDESGHWRRMTAGKSGTLRTALYVSFRYEEGTLYDVRWIPGGDLPAAYAVDYVGARQDAIYEFDTFGNITAMTVEHDESTDHSPFAAYTKVVFARDENGEFTGAEVFDRNERRIGRGIYVPENGWLYLFSVSR